MTLAFKLEERFAVVEILVNCGPLKTLKDMLARQAPSLYSKATLILFLTYCRCRETLRMSKEALHLVHQLTWTLLEDGFTQ